MSFKLILFDADDTLFDFAKSEVVAFENTILPHIGEIALEHVFERYKKISRKLWSRVEKGKANNNYLKVERFRRLKRLFKLKYDARVISEQYLDHLSQQAFLLEGAEELCRELHKNYRLGIVTNGIEHVQRRRLASSPLAKYFDFMIVSEECGFAKPDPRIFKYTLEKALHEEITSVLMVGDRLEADIAGANVLGIATCWYNPSKIPRTGAIPTFEIHSLKDLLGRLKAHTNKKFWDDNAENWNRIIESDGIGSRAVTNPAILQEILKRKPRRVLDVGCGEGWLSAPLAAQGIEYLGIDGSIGLTQLAQKHKDKLENITFEAVSYAQIEKGQWKPPVPVDLIVFNFSLLDEEIVSLLRAAKTYLNASGSVLIQTLNPRGTSESGWQLEDFKTMKGAFKGTMPWYGRTLEKWLEVFIEAGLQLEEAVEPVYENKPASIIFILKKN
jgi:putative hydrolase of the HAD superfamily